MDNNYRFTQPNPQCKPLQEPLKPAGLKDNIFLLLSFICSYIFFQLIFFGGFGIGVTIFCAFFYLILILYINDSKKLFNKTSVISLIPVVCLAICFAVFDNSVMRFFNSIFLWAAVMFNISAMAGLERKPVFSIKNIGNMFVTGFALPFSHIGTRISAFNASFKSKSAKKILLALLSLVVISPFAIIILLLLSQSDDRFSAIIRDATGFFSDNVWEYVLKGVLALIVTFPLFTQLYNLKNNELKPEGEKSPASCQNLDAICTGASLYVFDFIYAVYIAIQADYFFSAIMGKLPHSFTYASYARKGFFELVVVVSFNMVLIFLTFLLTKRKNDKLPIGARLAALLLIISNELLTVTAISKMVLYVSAYGLTQLRVDTLFFMVLLFITGVYTLIKLFIPNFKFAKFVTVSFITLYLALNFMNTDALIAKYNIDRYYVTGKLDFYALFDLSDSAIPQISRLKDDPKYKTEIERFFYTRARRYEAEPFGENTLSKITAYELYFK